jgi:hypothetical protein
LRINVRGNEQVHRVRLTLASQLRSAEEALIPPASFPKKPCTVGSCGLHHQKLFTSQDIENNSGIRMVTMTISGNGRNGGRRDFSYYIIEKIFPDTKNFPPHNRF